MSITQNTKNIKKGFGQALFLGSELGFLIALPLVVCILLGLFFDQKFDKFPVFLLMFIFIGIVLTIIDVYKLVLPFLEKRSLNKNNKN
ncbi:MAG: AtpZ/AtpI family protein [Candidatus Pacebacteria bacterium]|jgi:F0F1-type ATP synthase assembly protein I|nr:AtpZ/AtpI family protein [Candidatus Paceibacterota bacterium]MDD5012836.1 AtpZ/AtpI family protein [Candidatus Paceibacterota bacterium]MDD5752851.1 AtpZ/AtpI family protein [Candidatus Paceibacterota bacterium]